MRRTRRIGRVLRHAVAGGVTALAASSLAACAAPAQPALPTAPPSAVSPSPSRTPRCYTDQSTGLFICPGDATDSPSLATPGAPSAGPVHGLVAIRGIGLAGASAGTVELLNPATGSVERTITFPFPAGVHVGWDAGDELQQDAQLVSPDLEYLAAYESAADGTTHMGVLSAQGQFTDLSGPISGADSFAGALTAHRELMSGGRFYFDLSKMNGTDHEVFSLPLSAISGTRTSASYRKEAVTQVPDETGEKFRVAPDGTVTVGTSCQKAYGGWGIQMDAFIDAHNYIRVETGLERYPLADSCSDVPDTSSGKALLPPNAQIVEAAAVSPDHSKIAFVAKSGEVATLWQVPTDGGTPSKVGNFSDAGSTLIAWI